MGFGRRRGRKGGGGRESERERKTGRAAETRGKGLRVRDEDQKARRDSDNFLVLADAHFDKTLQGLGSLGRHRFFVFTQLNPSSSYHVAGWTAIFFHMLTS